MSCFYALAELMPRGASLMSNPNPHKIKEPERRDLVMYCCLIDIPGVGPILWETGCGKDYPEVRVSRFPHLEAWLSGS